MSGPTLAKTRRFVATSAAVVVGLASGARFPVPSPQAAAAESASRVPVLVELFTSEGCSSCPAAEDELSRLEAEQPLPGVRILAAEFHVDYWNDLGWVDPFSRAAWSARQAEYDRSRGGRVYTPQAVVNGTRECVGSDDRALRELARERATQPTARVELSLSSAPSGREAVRVSVAVSAVPSIASGDEAEVRVMLVERGLSTDVRGGENGGHRLRHAPLVRELVSAGVVAGASDSRDASLELPPGSRRENLSVVAVVQEKRGRRILGVASRAL